ncbi:MAG: hypothetical protein LJF06_03275 [Gemmatimonadetes bacterium]|nr:hypothetical protein [Gemmatimonadota bacterium]
MPDDAPILERLNAALTDRYVLERELGEGGMALPTRGTPPFQHPVNVPRTRPVF